MTTKPPKDDMKEKLILGVLLALAKEVITKGPKFIKENIIPIWKKTVSWAEGKTISIIGATASGKNSMFSQLKNETPPDEHVQTRGTDKIKSFKIKRSIGNETVEFWCRNAVNVGGEIDEKERYWQQACEGSDIIFYLIDFHQLKHNESATIKRIRSDFKWLAANISKFKPGRQVYIFLNKIDLYAEEIEEKDDLKTYLSNLVEEDSKKIEKMATLALGDNSSVLSGISPISMLNKTIFENFFNSALMNIYLRQKEK